VGRGTKKLARPKYIFLVYLQVPGADRELCFFWIKGLPRGCNVELKLTRLYLREYDLKKL